MNQVTAKLISNAEIMPGAYLVWVEAAEIAPEAEPGQFVMVHCGEEVLLRRPLSIHQQEGDRIALLFNVVGKGTQWLSERQAGEGIDLLGPLGNSFSIHEGAGNLLLVAGGMGIAPLRFLAQKALNRGRAITLLLGAATASQLYPGQLLPAEVQLVVATEDGTSGERGMVTDLIPDFAGEADQVFACGPPGMYRSMVELRGSINKPVQISLEVRMGCGRGICYGCTVKTRQGLKQVCADGPVFDLDDLLPDELDLI